jgi:hypothetical protein
MDPQLHSFGAQHMMMFLIEFNICAWTPSEEYRVKIMKINLVTPEEWHLKSMASIMKILEIQKNGALLFVKSTALN